MNKFDRPTIVDQEAVSWFTIPEPMGFKDYDGRHSYAAELLCQDRNQVNLYQGDPIFVHTLANTIYFQYTLVAYDPETDQVLFAHDDLFDRVCFYISPREFIERSETDFSAADFNNG